MTEVQKALERALDAWKVFDRDSYANAFAPRFTCVHPFGTDTTADAVRKHVDDTQKFWSKCDYRIEKVVGDNQHGAVHYVTTMTPRDTGDSVDVPITSMIDIEDGLITYWLEVFDSVTIRKALKPGQKTES